MPHKKAGKASKTKKKQAATKRAMTGPSGRKRAPRRNKKLPPRTPGLPTRIERKMSILSESTLRKGSNGVGFRTIKPRSRKK